MIKPKEFGDDIIDKVVELYKSDIKISSIGKQLHISDANVKRCLIKRGVTLKGNKFGSLKYKHLDNILNKDYVLEKYDELLSIGKLAEHFECGVDMIQSVFKLHQIESREYHEIRELKLKNERIEPVTDENIIKAYIKDLLTIKQISDKFRIANSKIYKVIKKYNLKRELASIYNKSKNKYKLFNYDELKRVRDSYDNLESAASHIGCDLTTLQKQLKKFNIPPYNKTESRIKSMIKIIENNLKNYSIINYDKKLFTISHNSCNKIFELSHSSVNQYSNGRLNSEYLCPICFNRKHTSSKENEICSMLDNNNVKYIKNVRSILGNRELDIFIPEKNIAIEYCGLYWHSNLYKDKFYHLDKLQRCKEKGIRLITIFEDEWLGNKELVETKLKHILNIDSSERIFARKCTINTIDSKTRNEFLDKHHIQGRDKATYSYGLFYNNILVAVASFSKPNISKGGKVDDGIYELSRYATNSNVIGGLGKLLKYFEYNVKPKELFTYADKRWSNGNLYETLGFVKLKDTKPNYWYLNSRNIERKHRFSYRKTILKKLYPDIYDDKLSEFDIAEKAKLLYIWDCGNLKYKKVY